MRTLALIGLVTAGLSGCVVYEKDRHGDDDYEDGYDDLDGDENGLEDSGLGEDGDEEPAVTLAFYPSEAEQGQAFIGYLTVTEGELELSAIEELSFYGDVEVVSYDIRDDEVIISLDVSPNAVLGEVDLLVDMGGNDVIWMEAAFTIFEAGSGGTDGGSTDGGTDGGSTDGGGNDGGTDGGNDGGHDTGCG